jgi:hypothetical protein
MAYTRTLPQEVLTEIARQIGNRQPPPPPHDSDPVQPVQTIAETFEVWSLITGVTKEYEAGNRELASLARPSGVWHHQLRTGENATAFARSKPLGPTPDTWSLRALFWSPLATTIAKAIEWADSNVPDQVEARLLSVRFQQTEAFWFVTAPDSELAPKWNDKLYILTAPKQLLTLQPGTLVDSKAFLEAVCGPKRLTGVIVK